MAVVPGDDPQIIEPFQILPGGFRITVDGVGDSTRRRRLACLEDGTVDALLDVVIAERLLSKLSEDSVSEILGVAGLRI